MANTRTMEQELRYIENFFDNLSVEDFEEMIENCYSRDVEDNSSVEDCKKGEL